MSFKEYIQTVRELDQDGLEREKASLFRMYLHSNDYQDEVRCKLRVVLNLRGDGLNIK